MRLEVGPRPPESVAWYDYRGRRIVVAERALDEHPRALAAVPAHEIVHVLQASHGRLDIAECVQFEAEASRQQSYVWRRLWDDGDPPTRKQLEMDLTTVAAIASERGDAGLRKYVRAHPGYRHACRLDAEPADAAAVEPQPRGDEPSGVIPGVASGQELPDWTRPRRC